MADLTRRELVGSTAAAALAMAAGSQGLAPAGPCNVLVLKSDEHNPMVSSPYGHPVVRTPNMQRLARMGSLYEAAYCASPLCLPSRSAYMSGRYVHEIQAYSNCSAIRSDHPSYGRELAGQGVHTVHIGKTDVYQATDRLGFSEVIEPWDRDPPGDTSISRHPLCIRTDAHLRANGHGVPANGANPHASDERLVDLAIGWLDRNAATLGRPWTLEVNLGAPHFPHFVTQAEWDAYPNSGDLPRYGRDQASAQHPIAQDLRRHFETDLFAEADVRGLRRGYLGCVSFIDTQLGRLLDAYQRLGLADNTVVVYTSDHGEMLGKFGMWWKCSLYEDSVRVPLLVAGPGFAPGVRVRTPVTQLDLQASLFRATGSRRPTGWHGSPLQSVGRDDRHRVAFSEYHGHGTRCSAYMIRRGGWKLHYHAEAPCQLFDLGRDPQELHDLAGRRPEVVAELTGCLREICDPGAENRRAEERILAELRAIGNRTGG